MRRISGAAQHYDWGDHEAIPAILGLAADGRPWAEWWLGTHPGAPATIVGGGPLADTSGELPFLLKLLAAAHPLSMQTHPTAAQAAVGFAREEGGGLAIDARTRLYHDPFAKPELLCALTQFDVLCGFRPAGETEALLHELGATEVSAALRQAGLPNLLVDLYRGHIDPASTIAACARSPRPEAELVRNLWRQYPGDPSVVVTLLLNRLTLRPGQAIYLGPGNLHAYLHGVGVEVMGSSDNVVRGGLTSKHVDVDELLSVVDVVPIADPLVVPVEVEPGRWRYPTAGTPFTLWRFDITSTMPHTAIGRELLLCTQGDVGVLHHGESVYLAPGESVVLGGPSTVFCAQEATGPV